MALGVGSRCLAYHGPLLYEAKVMKVYDPQAQTISSRAPGGETLVEAAGQDEIPREVASQVAYFVHYKGWKSTWDEWILRDRVLAWNEENIRMQKELKQAALEAVHAKSKRPTTAAATMGGGGGAVGGATSGDKRKDATTHKDEMSRGQKRGRMQDLEIEKEEDFVKRPEVSLAVPDSLKAQLVDDWEYVTKEHQLVTLPRKPNVVDILREYRDANPKRPGSAEADIFDEVLSGIKLYFDRSLGNILLYRFERQQYLEVKKSHESKSMSEIYGAEHLLRLFVSLPGLIAQTNMDQQSVGYLRDHLEDFLRYMAKSQDKLFQNEYENTSSRYEANAKGI
jgi:mortality factor 4-like protein 1